MRLLLGWAWAEWEVPSMRRARAANTEEAGASELNDSQPHPVMWPPFFLSSLQLPRVTEDFILTTGSILTCSNMLWFSQSAPSTDPDGAPSSTVFLSTTRNRMTWLAMSNEMAKGQGGDWFYIVSLPLPVSLVKKKWRMVNNFFPLCTEHQSLRAVPPDSSPRSYEQERPLSFDSSAFLTISLSWLHPLEQRTCCRAGKHMWHQPTGLAAFNFHL